jgi:transposase InsO family protein
MLLDKYHSTHFGYHRLYESIKPLFSNITQKHCRDFTLKCPVCATYTPAVKDPHITPILSSRPFERLVMDLKDFKDFVIDNNGFRYAMTVVDHFSGYPWVFTLKNKTAEEVKDKLVVLFKKEGIPEMFQSDNGGEFKGEVDSLLEKLQIKFVHGKPRTPREQGKVEKFNGTLGEKLSKMMVERKTR